MKRKGLLTAGLLLLLLLSACGPLGLTQQTDRTLNVSGRGEVYVVPDIAYVYVGVRSEAESVTDALDMNNVEAMQVSQTLQSLGVAPEDIQTSAFNVYPQQEYGPEGQIVRTYYVVENSVFVRVRALDRLGEILDQVVRSGANKINGVTFDVEDREAATAEARRQAIANARAKAQEMAEAAGIELGDLQTIHVYGSDLPIPLVQMEGRVATDMSGAPIAAGQLVLTAEASLTYLIR